MENVEVQERYHIPSIIQELAVLVVVQLRLHVALVMELQMYCARNVMVLQKTPVQNVMAIKI